MLVAERRLEDVGLAVDDAFAEAGEAQSTMVGRGAHYLGKCF
jgi:hypothetical protein